jgi:hypothetical protein
MKYKKIILTPKSGLISELESDTILSYIFAFNFEKLNNIYIKFQEWKEIPFSITSWFLEWELPKPIYFQENSNKVKGNLLEDIKNEVDRKKLKKVSTFPIEKEYFKLLFDWKQKELEYKIKELLCNKEENHKYKEKTQTISEYKNSIPRFNIWETNPYIIDNIKYISWNYVIYIKVYNEDDFNLFFDCFKTTFESIWFWKWKSRWYWKFKLLKSFDLDEKELEVFNYFEKLDKEKNLKVVLNNYKPTNNEIKNFDLNKSFYKLNNKHTKSLSEFNKNIFKWKMSFISHWSVISTKEKLVWDYYNSNNSYNFGYIF